MAVAGLKNLFERYQACFVLHAVGDAMGYRNGKWELNYSGPDIHKELDELGGIEALSLDPINWRLSDDSIFHLANAECLIENKNFESSSPDVYIKLVNFYKNAMNDMQDRGPGKTTAEAVLKLKPGEPNGYLLPYNSRGGGCGCAMRSSCIGLRYSKPEQLDSLIEFSVKSGMMTHHNPIGYLGGLTTALFTSYAIQGIPVKSWGAKGLEILERTRIFVEKYNYFVEENLKDWPSFIKPWKNYLITRDIKTGTSEPKFPEVYGPKERDEFYKSVAGKTWAGSSGVDSVLIAYDALLGCKGDWKELCLRAMLHGGDNDSTGCIAGSWYGALYGFNGVPEINYRNLEYKDRILNCAKNIFEIQYL